MKILQIGTAYRFGGIESYLLNYAQNINREGMNFDFLTFYETDEIKDFHEKIEKTGSKIYITTNYRRHPIKGLFEMIRIINNNNYDIVHYNMNSAVFLLPLIAGKLSHAKIVIAHAHNSSSDKGLIKNIIHNINKLLIPLFANNYFACSEEAGKWFFTDKIRKGKNYKIIKNAINTSKFKFNIDLRKKYRNELGFKASDIVVGHVGRFNEQKNHQFIIDVFEELYKLNKNYKLLLVGEGPTKKDILDKIAKLNCKNNIIVFNQRNDINSIMQAMDVFLLPSLYEGLPLVGIEAQCSGLKCFFSDKITKELNITNNAYYISLSSSPKQWANTIDIEIKRDNNRDYLDEIRKSGYDIKKSSDDLKKIYYSLLNIKKR